jgi:hypothetical protein
MSSIFLSHSHADKTFARQLAFDLRRNGHTVWFDEAEIEVGDSLIERIRDGIDRVEYVLAVISKKSVASAWVQRELDLASNREIEEGRVVVLPAILDDVELPGFLKGKCYVDFRVAEDYDESLKFLLRRVGSGVTPPSVSDLEKEELQSQVLALQKLVEYHSRESQRQCKLAKLNRSKALESAIQRENSSHPEWASINDAYAFESMGIPITIGYVLYAIRKAEIRGSHPMEIGLTLENKWDNLRLMVDAYSDYLGLKRQE